MMGMDTWVWELSVRRKYRLPKLSVISVRRGYWGNKIGKPHTVPCKVTGKCGSVTVRTVPAPRGAGIVAARVPKKVLQFAGIEDVFTLLLPEGLLRLLATLSRPLLTVS